MKIYVLMTKGDGKVICQDSVLVGNNILSEGYLEYTPAKGENVVVAVADGVGGNKAGEVASFMALYGLRNAKLFQGATVESVRRVISNANKNILGLAASDPEKMGNMATTLTGIVLGTGSQIAFHVGNTRLCKKNGIYLMPLTEAHEDANHHLIACLGIKPELLNGLEVTDVTASIADNQDLVLTTDGVHDPIEDIEMDAIFRNGGTIKELMYAMEAKAREKGSKDDISIIWVSRSE